MSLGFLTFQKGSPPCCPTPGPRFVGSETSPWKLRQTSRKGKKNCSECARAQSCCCRRLVAQLYPILCDPMDCSLPGSSVHGKSPGKNAGVSCHFLLQGVFLPQGLNLGLLHCRQILHHLSHQGHLKVKVKVTQWCLTLCNPMNCTFHGTLQARILEWVAFQPRDGSQVSHIAGRFFTS